MQTFLGSPVFNFAPNYQGIEHGQLDDVTLKPAGIGTATPWKPTTTFKRTLKLSFLFYTLAEWRAFREFFVANQGALQGFWLPIWITDYPMIAIGSPFVGPTADSGTITADSTKVTADASSGSGMSADSSSPTADSGSITADQTQSSANTSIGILPIGLINYFAPGNQYGYCALIAPQGTGIVVEPHKITEVNVSDGNEFLTLDKGVGSNFNAKTSILCGLMFARFSSPEIDYQFLTDGTVQCEVQFDELPKEYEAPGQLSTPVYLIEMTRGATTWRFTNFGTPIVIDGELYSQENAEIGDLKSAFDFIAESITLTLATDQPNHPARYYITNPRALEPTTVTIFKVDLSSIGKGITADSDQITIDNVSITADQTGSGADINRNAPYYVGIIGDNQPGKDGSITLKISSPFRIGEGPVPRPKIQRLCNHRLGDSGCQIDLSALAVLGTITQIQNFDPPFVSAVTFGATATAKNDPNYFALGSVVIGSETRFVVGQNGNLLYLDAPFNFATVGMIASATPGCDKRIHTCLNKFNNVAKNLSFPYVPNQTSYEAALTLGSPQSGKKI